MTSAHAARCSLLKINTTIMTSTDTHMLQPTQLNLLVWGEPQVHDGHSQPTQHNNNNALHHHHQQQRTATSTTTTTHCIIIINNNALQLQQQQRTASSSSTTTHCNINKTTTTHRNISETKRANSPTAATSGVSLSRLRLCCSLTNSNLAPSNSKSCTQHLQRTGGHGRSRDGLNASASMLEWIYLHAV